MLLTDTHTHLYLEQFDQDREEMMQRAFKSGVGRIFLPNIDSASIEPLLKMTGEYPGKCFPMMGLHPCSVNKNSMEKELSIVRDWLEKDTFYGIGEIGIDLYWDKTTYPEQEAAFRKQIEWAKELDMPIVIHSRNSFDEIFQVLDDVNDDKLRGIFHCFTGNIQQAKKIIDLGFYLGIGGVLTFKNSGLDKVVRDIALENIVLETDAPYLTPAPHRGKRNESAYLLLIAEKLAEIHNLTLEKVAEITTENSKKVFGT